MEYFRGKAKDFLAVLFAVWASTATSKFTSVASIMNYKSGHTMQISNYDKHIIMQSRRQSYIDFQDVNHITSRFNFA